jgi:hydrogenase maturation protease
MSSNASSATDLFIAFGNPLRGDDGAAIRVIEALKPAATQILIQPTIELAADIATAGRVIFVDAAVGGRLRLEQVEESYGSGASHVIGLGEIVAVSRKLYGFTGEAWLCRIPGKEFGVGEGLSVKALANVIQAVKLLRQKFTVN